MIKPVHIVFFGVRAIGVATGLDSVYRFTILLSLMWHWGPSAWKQPVLGQLVVGFCLGLACAGAGAYLFIFADTFARRWQGHRPMRTESAFIALAGTLLLVPHALLLLGNLSVWITAGPRFREALGSGSFGQLVGFQDWPENLAQASSGLLVILCSRQLANWADPAWRWQYWALRSGKDE